MKLHEYTVTVRWTGNDGSGTSSYRSYRRDYEAREKAKLPILGSSDPEFRGDGNRWSPEDLLVVSLSACHKLWYLHLCADSGVVVLDYEDHPLGTMVEEAEGEGQFTNVVLRPKVTISANSDPESAARLHHEAHAKCFIARSMNFEVTHEPTIERAAGG